MYVELAFDTGSAGLLGVGGDDDAVELGAGTGGFEDPGEHGSAGDDAKDFTGESRGGEACGNDSEDGGGPLFAGCGIKYDGSWLCRGDVSQSKRICAGVP